MSTDGSWARGRDRAFADLDAAAPANPPAPEDAGLPAPSGHEPLTCGHRCVDGYDLGTDPQYWGYIQADPECPEHGDAPDVQPSFLLPKVTRVTVVTGDGVAFEDYAAYPGAGAEVLVQDDGRTVKIVPAQREPSPGDGKPVRLYRQVFLDGRDGSPTGVSPWSEQRPEDRGDAVIEELSGVPRVRP